MGRPEGNRCIRDAESILGPDAVKEGRVVLEEHDAHAEHHRVQESPNIEHVSLPTVFFVLSG